MRSDFRRFRILKTHGLFMKILKVYRLARLYSKSRTPGGRRYFVSLMENGRLQRCVIEASEIDNFKTHSGEAFASHIREFLNRMREQSSPRYYEAKI